MGAVGYVAIGLIAVGIAVFQRFRSNYRRLDLQVLGSAIAFVGSLILPFATAPAMIFAAFFTGLLLMASTSQLVLARRLRKARQLRPAREPRSPTSSGPTAPLPPPFRPEVIDLRDRLSEAGEVVGHPSGAAVDTATPVLFLWVFAPSANNGLINEVRQRFGPVEMLHGGGQLIVDLESMPSVLFGRANRHIEESEQEVLSRIAGFTRRRVGLPIPTGKGGRLAWWSYNSMLCTDGVWKFALDRLIERNEVFVMDLTDFSAEHDGCEYEIGVLLDRVPVRRCLFVIGLATDQGRVIDELRSAWETMAATSPNRDPASGPARLVLGAHLRDERRRGQRNVPGIAAERALFLDLLRTARG